jgi:Holliday junction resolvase-like predicted endonuclease
MKQGQYIAPIYRLSLRDPETVPRRISYSQWSMYERCPLSWKLAYIDGLAPFQASIDTTFGTAFHETFQHFLTVMYTESVKKAENLDFRSILQNKLREEYVKCVTEMGGEHFSNPLQLAEYLEDGVAILEWFKKRRSTYFSSKGWELVGIELDLCVQASDANPSVYWYGFVDVIMRHVPTNRIVLFDIKTSRQGWNKYQKADSLKAAQLVAYKNYFSKQFNVPKENIDVEFFIVKRKMIEDSMFPQKRIQNFRPSSGTVTQKKVQRQIESFVEQCFDQEGNKNADAKYLAISGKGDKNCKYCFAKELYDVCPKENRIRE